MKTQKTLTVSEFIRRNTSKDLVDGLTVLSRLKYPIHDRYSFECALEELSEDMASNVMLSHSFRAQDFPIFSVESSFEKYFDKYQPFPMPLPLIPVPPIEFPDSRYTPSACDVYSNTTFSEDPIVNSDAAQCACSTYAEALRGGFNHLQATLIGHFAGRRYSRTLRCI